MVWLLSLSFTLLLRLVSSQSDLQCITVRATVSTTAETKTPECPAAYPQMVSCGVQSISGNVKLLSGVYMAADPGEGLTCRTIKVTSVPATLYVYGRCCAFTNIPATCNAFTAPLTPQISVNAACSDAPTYGGTAYQYPFGCSPWNADGNLTGCYQGDTTPDNLPTATDIDIDDPANIQCRCSGRGSANQGIEANLMCCDVDNPGLTCKLRVSAQGRNTALIGCSAGYAMIGCMGWSPNEGRLNRWFIDNSTDECKVRAYDASPMFAIGTCCQATPTSAPTADPTTNPTQNPTEVTSDPTTNPTFNPSTNPTTNPTSNPSSDPTMNPTPAPTTNPTNEPTNDPTADPTNNPTTEPTLDPTNDPTFDPTTDPTNEPTTDPTYDPTYDPTIDPTMEPTSDPTNDPTSNPTEPTSEPTLDPTLDPTFDPTTDPTNYPSVAPTETCDTLIVNIKSILYNGRQYNDSAMDINIGGAINISHQHWNGHYLENQDGSSFRHGRPTWSKDSNEDLLNRDGLISWRPNSWVLYSGITGDELLFLNDFGLHPPTNQLSRWVYYADFDVTADIELECSDSIAPTNAPTFSPSGSPSQPPTDSPSFSPTDEPTDAPSSAPSGSPSQPPTDAPSDSPVVSPTGSPSQPPTSAPSPAPSDAPSSAPSQPPTQSPTTSCELLRLRVIDVIGGDLAYFQSALDSSFEQLTNQAVNYRSHWLRLRDSSTIQYDDDNNEWIIRTSNEFLTVPSAQEMPPTNGVWTLSTNSSVKIEINTQCVVYTHNPTMEPTDSPSTDPTQEPTLSTSAPTTDEPTTGEPTTGEPTINSDPTNGECTGYGIPIAFELSNNALDEAGIERVIMNAFVAAIIQNSPAAARWNDTWCAVVDELTIDGVAVPNRRRRILQDEDGQSTLVEATIQVNTALYDEVLNDPNFDESQFVDDFENNLIEELEDEDNDGDQNNDGPVLSQFRMDEVIITMTTTMAPTSGGDDANDLPLGLGEECGAFDLLCWQLYAIIFAFFVVLIAFIILFCCKTKKDVEKIKWNAGKSEVAKQGGLEMQALPTTPNSPELDDGQVAKSQTDNLDL